MTKHITLSTSASSEGIHPDSLLDVLQELKQAYKDYGKSYSKTEPSPQVWLLKHFRSIIDADASVAEKFQMLGAFQYRLKELIRTEKNKAHKQIISDFLRVNLRDYVAYLKEKNIKPVVLSTTKRVPGYKGTPPYPAKATERRIHPDFSRTKFVEENTENKETKRLNLEKIAPNQLSLNDIEQFFSRLYKIKNPLNGRPFLSRLDTKALLKQSIGTKVNTTQKHQYFILNIEYFQKDFIKEFVYWLYQKNDGGNRGSKTKYVNFLKQHFSNFQSNENLYKDMRAGKNKNANPLLKK